MNYNKPIITDPNIIILYKIINYIISIMSIISMLIMLIIFGFIILYNFMSLLIYIL